MAETRTARLSLPQWSDGATDAPSRADFNEAFLNLENSAAIFGSGTLANRPASTKAGYFYLVTGDSAVNNNVLWYSNGASWIRIGSNLVGTVVRPENNGLPALVAQGLASQSGNLQEWKDSVGNILARISQTGAAYVPSINATGTVSGATGGFTTLNVNNGGSLSGDFNFNGQVTMYNYVSAAKRVDGVIPKTEIRSDGYARIDGLIPPGTIVMTAGTTAPTGWILCQGQVLTRTSNQDLFNVIGTAYNTGGETTSQFRLPNLQGRVPVGSGAGYLLGGLGGASEVVLLPSQMPMHTHNIPSHTHTGLTFEAGNHSHIIPKSTGAAGHGTNLARGTSTMDGESSSSIAPNGGHEHGFLTDAGGEGNTGYSGSSGSHPNMQPYQVLNYMIKN